MKQINKLFLGVGLSFLLSSFAYAMDLPKEALLPSIIPVNEKALPTTPNLLLTMLCDELHEFFVENKEVMVEGENRSMSLKSFITEKETAHLEREYLVRHGEVGKLEKELENPKYNDLEWISRCLMSAAKIVQPLNKKFETINNEIVDCLQRYMEALYSKESTLELAQVLILCQKKSLENIIPGKKLIILERDHQLLSFKFHTENELTRDLLKSILSISFKETDHKRSITDPRSDDQKVKEPLEAIAISFKGLELTKRSEDSSNSSSSLNSQKQEILVVRPAEKDRSSKQDPHEMIDIEENMKKLMVAAAEKDKSRNEDSDEMVDIEENIQKNAKKPSFSSLSSQMQEIKPTPPVSAHKLSNPECIIL